jgi:hypothetical protein
MVLPPLTKDELSKVSFSSQVSHACFPLNFMRWVFHAVTIQISSEVLIL